MHTNVEATRRPPHFASSKFAPPGLVSCLVPRQRLFDVLDSGASRHLTLVVGSPGAGKTTLLANWFAARPDRPAAWLACDSSDSDPLRFVAGLIDAMRRGFGDPDVGESALQLLDLDGEVSMDLLAVLTDDLEGHPGERVLVIDDFHLAGGSDTALADFLQSRPPSLHVVVASRSEPQLRLHRMRTRDELVELRDHDLAFSVEETDDYLSALGLDLPDHDVSVINERTEGWSTGVQMVAISLRTSPDPLASVRWSDVKAHAISGYFVEEVLSRQPESVVDFMLATSVLEELSIPACTALVGEGAAAMLEYLCASHLFVTVSDESERTYRYHQLIRGVLQDELHTRDPQHEVQLHEAAARHLLHAGRAASAARHLLAAGDADGAFNLLSDNVVRDVLTNPTTSSVLDFDEFRPELFRGIPSVLIPLAAELLWRGAFDRGSRAVVLARQCPIDANTQPELAVRMALVNTLLHTFVGEFDAALTQRETTRALAEKATGVDDWIETLDALAMYCNVYAGRYREARDLADRLRATGTSAALTEILCPGVTSQAALLEGELDEAATLAAQALDAARRFHFDRHFFVFHALRTTSQLALERRDLPAALESAEWALSIVNSARPAFNFLAQVDRARIWAAGGDHDVALASLPQARAALRSENSVLMAKADELEARLRAALGDQRGALSAAGRLPDPRRIVVETVLALAAGDTAAAERVLAGAPATGSTTRLDVELQLLRANVALHRAGTEAPRHVRQALKHAHELGFVQTILDTAPQLIDHVVANPDVYPDFTELAQLARARSTMQTGASSRRTALVEPLTEAEIRVLAKLAERLSYAAIASELYLSLNTVKTHLRHAYIKLGVSSRSSAIARATTLGLL